MNVEICLSSAQAKSRALAALRRSGYHAESGSVRLAYPFAVLVEDVPDTEAVTRVARSVDPTAGMILSTPTG